MGNAIDLVRAHYAASDRGDLAGMLALIGPDTTWTEAAGSGYAGTYTGPDQVREQVFGRIAADWEGFAAAVDELVDGGAVVVALGRYTGRHRATGRTVSARFAHVWHLADGRASRFEQITDTALVNAAATP